MDIMGREVTEHQPKERLRTRWTAALDNVFVNLVVEQIELGHRPNNIFDKKAWAHVREEFNKQSGLNFNNNQLRKHLDVLRARYNQITSASVQKDSVIDDSCCSEFDLSEGKEVKPEPVKKKDCPIYEQLCIIFADSEPDGKYAQSSHYVEMENKSIPNNANSVELTSVMKTEAVEVPAPAAPPLSSKSSEVKVSSVAKGDKTKMENKKRKRSSEVEQNGPQQRDHEILDSLAEAMLDLIAASKLRTFTKTASKDMFSITNCVKALDEIESMLEESLYFAALDLFDDPNIRETFISLKDIDRRLRWLQGKCSTATVC